MRPLPTVPARLAACLLVAVSLAAPLRAQVDDGDWRAYPAYNEAQAVSAGGGRLWVGTPGGVFGHDPATGETVRYSPIDGLHGGDLQTVAYDDARGVLWTGYADGAIDRIEPATGRVTEVLDVFRAAQFSPRGVRRIRVRGDSLLLATDFGIVVYDPVAGVVRNTYARLGSLPAGTSVNDVAVAPLPDGRLGLWAATERGIVYAPLDGALQSPAPWTADAGFPAAATALVADGATLYAGGGGPGARDLYRREASGIWSRQTSSDLPISEILVRSGVVLAVQPLAVSVLRPGSPFASLSNPRAISLTGIAFADDGRLWASDGGFGLLPLAAVLPAQPETFALDPVVPDGPFSNTLADVDVGPDGTVWVATRLLQARSASAIGRLDAGGWTNYLDSDPALDIGLGGYRRAVVGPDGLFYVGGTGSATTTRDGLTVVGPDGPTLYNETNSSLLGAAGSTFVITAETAFEGGTRWVLNEESPRPLHYFGADGTWAGLPHPAGLNTTVRIERIVVDRSGYKWVAYDRNGIAVWDTGADPADPADDRARAYTTAGSGGQGLPATAVRALAVDGQGRVWLGTTRGIAYVFSPGSAFAQDPGLATPQWPVVVGADGDGDADYLLGSVEVNDMATDPAGRVWIATQSGAYLLNAEGNDVDRQIDSRNSPLPTDAIERVAVDPASGRVFFTTAFGLYSVDGDATVARPASDELAVAPNPFRPGAADAPPGGVLVSGLNAARAQVRILTVAGDVVHARETAGGSFRWDGRDDRSGALVPSGVYIVAAASEGGPTIYGKVAVLR